MKKRFVYALVLSLMLSLMALPAFAQIDVQSTLFDDTQFTARVHINPDEEPVYIVLDQVTIGGVPFDATGDNFSDMWSGYPQGTENKSLTYEFFVLLDEGSVSPAENNPQAALAAIHAANAQTNGMSASFRITLLAPRQNIVEVDCAFTGDSEAAWQQIDEIVSRGDTPVESEEPYTARVSSDAFDEIRYDEPVCFPLGNVDALTKYANMVVVEQRRFELYGFNVMKNPG